MSISTETAPSNGAATPEATKKRGPGRPKKDQGVAAVTSVRPAAKRASRPAETPTAGTRRGPGRPKKDQSAAPAPAPKKQGRPASKAAATPAVPAPRKRGRVAGKAARPRGTFMVEALQYLAYGAGNYPKTHNCSDTPQAIAAHALIAQKKGV